MAEYFPKLRNRYGNVLYMDDGTVWANYLLRGINVNHYDGGSVAGAQFNHNLLFAKLSHLDIAEGLLCGFKGTTNPQVIMNAVIEGLPNANNKNYAQLQKQLNAFYQKLVITGEYKQHERVYILSLRMPTEQSWKDRQLGRAAEVDVHRGISNKEIRAYEESYYSALPTAFGYPVGESGLQVLRAGPNHARFTHDRARQRGIDAPIVVDPYTAVMSKDTGGKNFARIGINKVPDKDALLNQLVERIKQGDLPGQARSVLPWKKDQLERSFLSTFRSVRNSAMIAIENHEDRSTEFPDGPISYQSMVAIAQYPDEPSFDVNAVTNIVDTETAVDADFAIRFDFSQEYIRTEFHRKQAQTINSEDESNSKDELDSEDYDQIRGGLRGWRDSVIAENRPRGMRVCVTFAFAHQNRAHLEARVTEIMQRMENENFVPLRPVGGQFELWQGMHPGCRMPSVVEDLMHVTTVAQFAPMIPIRRSFIGDTKGVPIGRNKENALGQIVLEDLQNATDRGNASRMFLGSQGSGKSYAMKVFMDYMANQRFRTRAIDHQDNGEWSTFMRVLHDALILDVVDGDVSLDILKCLPMEIAAAQFLQLWVPLLGLDVDSEEGRLLKRLLVPSYRQSRFRKINSTRDLVRHLKTLSGDTASVLYGKFDYWVDHPLTRCLIDPTDPDTGMVINLPAFTGEHYNVVFRTHKLPQVKDNNWDGSTKEERLGTMVMTLIAFITRRDFTQDNIVSGFFADEVSFLKGTKAIEYLVRDPDAKGRKERNMVFIGVQLAQVLDENYAQIAKVHALRQDNDVNAEAALTKVGVPPTARQKQRMISETSPRDGDRNNMPVKGRGGEGWYNDANGNLAFMQFYDHMLDSRRKAANTLSSEFVRYDDIIARERELAAAGATVGAHHRADPLQGEG